MPAGLYAPMPTNIDTKPFTLFWTASSRFLSTLTALGFFLYIVLRTGRRVTEPLGLSSTTLAPLQGDVLPPLLASAASHPLRDGRPVQRPDRSLCRHRRSRCRPGGLHSPSIDAHVVQLSSSKSRLPSILVQGHPLTKMRLPPELRSSPCRLMPWHCTLTELLRCGEQKDAAVTSEVPPLS